MLSPNTLKHRFGYKQALIAKFSIKTRKAQIIYKSTSREACFHIGA
jgi:hypothetical protein